MGTDYHMVKGKEKVYIGRHIIPDEIPVLYANYREIMEEYVGMEDYNYYDATETPFIKLSLDSMYLLYDRVKKFGDVLELLNKPLLLVFFITSDYDPMDGLWVCVEG